MKYRLSAALLLAVVIPAAALRSQDAQKDLDKLQGTWVLTAMEKNGKAAPEYVVGTRTMKLLQRLITLACILAAPFTHAAGKPAGNAPAGVKKPAETRMPSSESAEQIKAMPPCKATVEEHHSCYSIFRTADGKKFSIGSPAATQDVVQFLQTLKNGQTYEFPSAFLDYQKKAPTYETAEQIKAMPPCQATVEHIGVRDSRITTADGKMFFIGSRAATQEVVQFLKTLKDGQTYKFPSVFLDYQKKK